MPSALDIALVRRLAAVRQPPPAIEGFAQSLARCVPLGLAGLMRIVQRGLTGMHGNLAIASERGWGEVLVESDRASGSDGCECLSHLRKPAAVQPWNVVG